MKRVASMSIALLLTTVLSACAKKDEPINQVGSLTPAEAKDIAKDGYVFGMPLVYFAQQQDILTNVARPEGTRAPYNQFAHYRDFPDPSNRTVVGWNVALNEHGWILWRRRSHWISISTQMRHSTPAYRN